MHRPVKISDIATDSPPLRTSPLGIFTTVLKRTDKLFRGTARSKLAPFKTPGATFAPQPVPRGPYIARGPMGMVFKRKTKGASL